MSTGPTFFANEYQKDRTRIIAAIKELISAGYVRTEYRKPGNNGRVLLPAGCGTDHAAAQAEQTEETAQHAALEDADTQEEPSGEAADAAAGEAEGGQEGNMPMKMNVQVGGSTFTAALEDNAAAEAFAERMEQSPVTIQMSDYAGFEKVGALETGLPAEDSRITTQAGDIVLYQGDQIVVFYGSNT